MGLPTKVQLIKRKESEQWYINFPSAVAQAMEFERGETVEWIIEDKSQFSCGAKRSPQRRSKKRQPAFCAVVRASTAKSTRRVAQCQCQQKR